MIQISQGGVFFWVKIMNYEIIGTQVLIRRRSPEEIFPGAVQGQDRTGKIVVRRFKSGVPNGEEFKAPSELLNLGYAQNRRGQLRFAWVPMSPEAELFMADKQQV